MKLAHMFSLLTSFVMIIAALNVDWQYIALAGGGSFAGAVILAYFRRESNQYEQLYKILAGTIAGIIIGAGITEYRQLTAPSYIAVTFFLAGSLNLLILRTIVSMTESNAQRLTTTLVQRIFNVNLGDGEPPAAASRRSKSAGPRVTPTDSVPPETNSIANVQIKETVIETKETK